MPLYTSLTPIKDSIPVKFSPEKIESGNVSGISGLITVPLEL